MKQFKIYFPLLLLVLISSVACKKKCVIEGDDVNAGAIIPEVIFYPESGYMTSGMGGNYVVDATSPYADNFQITYKGGAKTPVNYSNYKILCYPTSAKCNAFYERTVTIDDVAQTVLYKIIVTQCSDCEEVRQTENYVLVPTFPSSYTISYDVSYVDK